MKRIILTTLILLTSLSMSAKDKWMQVLDEIHVPHYFTDAYQIYIKYTEPIDGFTVTAKFFPFESSSETGSIILHLYKASTGESYFYVSTIDDKHTNSDIMDIAFSPEGYEFGKTYLFDYIRPDDPKNSKVYEVDTIHPLGYYTPFQFLDVDFDGQKEFLLNNFGQIKGGNEYLSYKLSGHEMIPIAGHPVECLTNSDQYDAQNKTITTVIEDGCWEYAEYTYQYTATPQSLAPVYPEFHSFISEFMIERSLHPHFRLISVYEKVGNEEFNYNFE